MRPYFLVVVRVFIRVQLGSGAHRISVAQNAISEKIINDFLSDKDASLSALKDNIATVLGNENDKATDDIDGTLDELQRVLMLLAVSKNNYISAAVYIHRLRELQ